MTLLNLDARLRVADYGVDLVWGMEPREALATLEHVTPATAARPTRPFPKPVDQRLRP